MSAAGGGDEVDAGSVSLVARGPEDLNDEQDWVLGVEVKGLMAALGGSHHKNKSPKPFL